MTEAEISEVNRLTAKIATESYADRIKFIAVNTHRSAFAVSYEPSFSSQGLIRSPRGDRDANGTIVSQQGHVFAILGRDASLQQGLYKVGEE